MRCVLPIEVNVPSGLARFADLFGRRLAIFRRHNKHKNNLRTTLERAIEMTVLGARGEAALYWYLGGHWGGADWDHEITNKRKFGELPDIVWRGDSYDAKGIDRNKLSLVVYPEGAKPHWRFVLVGVQFWPCASLLGWCMGSEVLTTPLKEKVPGRPAYYIEQKSPLLRSCAEFVSADDEKARIAKYARYLGD
jgi:hypothetical protein